MAVEPVNGVHRAVLTWRVRGDVGHDASVAMTRKWLRVGRRSSGDGAERAGTPPLQLVKNPGRNARVEEKARLGEGNRRLANSVIPARQRWCSRKTGSAGPFLQTRNKNRVDPAIARSEALGGV